ncbi:MAG: glycosyltransferase, partial [Acidobacteria bacterium]
GRIIPNKKLEDLLRAFALYQRAYDPGSRLLLVGDHWGYERYLFHLQAMARSLGAQDVVFTGQAEDEDLRGYYSAASAYVSLSEHEGFCVPLLEAMAAGVPALAYDAGAVAETLAGAGLLLRDKRPEKVAALLSRLVADPALRAAVLAGQQRRLETRRAVDFGSALLERLRPLLDASVST